MKFPTKNRLTRQHFICLQTFFDLTARRCCLKLIENKVRTYTFVFNNCLISYFVVHTPPLQIADENDLTNVHGTLVRKKGRVTGITEGILVSGVSTIVVRNGVSPLKYRFDYCYRIINMPGVKNFFKPGDSGSGVYLIDKEGEKKPLGIAFAYTEDGDTLACRIENITRAFDLLLYDEEESVTEPMDVDVDLRTKFEIMDIS